MKKLTLGVRLSAANSVLRSCLSGFSVIAVFLLALSLVGSSAIAQVTIPFYDGFPSSIGTGNLGPSGVDATAWSLGASSADITVGSSYALSYTGLQTPPSGSYGVDVKSPNLASNTQRDVGAQYSSITSGSVYVSFLLKVTTPISTSTYKDIVCLNQATSSFPSTSGKLNVMLNSSGALTINKAVNTIPTVFTGGTAGVGQTATLGTTTHLVVARYTFSTGSGTDDTVDLWLDPATSTLGAASAPAATVGGVGGGTTDAASLQSATIHINSSGSAFTGEWNIDEYRVGTTWAAVTPPALPAVTTQAASSIATTSATLNGTVTDGGGGSLTDRGFYWSTTPTVTTSSTKLSEGGTTVSAFSKSLFGLSANNIYYYRAYAINSGGTTLDGSGDTSFYTLAITPSAPTVTTPTPTTLNVAITSGDGNSTITTYAIKETASGNYVNHTTGALQAGADYQTSATWGTKTVTGLSAGNTYTFSVVAQNGAGVFTSFSPTTAGTTSSSATAPSVTTSAATSIGVSTSTLNGNVSADGGAAITERGFIYKTSSGVTISDNKTPVTGTTGSYSLSLSSLGANVQYFFNAYAINSVGTALAAEQNYWTLATTPVAPIVSAPIANNNTSLNVAIGSDSNSSTTTYAIKETTSGNYVQAGGGALGVTAVYQTAATWGTVTVTGLSASTTYTFAVVAKNGSGTITSFGTTASGTTTIYKYMSRTSGNWSDFNTWSVDRGTGSFVNAVSGETPSATNNTSIEIASPNTVTVSAATSAVNLTVDNGSTLNVSGGVLTVNHSLSSTKDLDLAGTLSLSFTTANALTFGSGALMTLESTGTLNHTGNATAISGGTLTFNGTYKQNIDQGVIPTATWSVGSTCEIDTTFNSSPAGALGYGQTFGNFVWNAANNGTSYTLSWAKLAGGNAVTSATIQGTMTVEYTGVGTFQQLAMRNASGQTLTTVNFGALTVTGGAFQLANSASFPVTMNVAGNVSIGGGTTDIHGSSTLNASGDVSVFNTGVLTGGTINFAKSGTQSLTVSASSAPTCAWNVNSTSTLNLLTGVSLGTSFIVSGTLNCGSNLLTGSGTFTLAAGGTLGIGDPNGITTSGAIGNIQVAGARTYTALANYVYNGTVAQATGNGLGSTTVNNLTVNNTFSTSPQLSLSQATTVNGTLTLTSGQLNTSAGNILKIGSAGSISGGSSSAFVSGPLAQVYGSAVSKIFPIGTNGNYRAVTLNLTTLTSATPTITVTPNEPSTWNTANTPASTSVFGARDWTVTDNGANAIFDVCTITVNGTDFSPGSHTAELLGYNGNSTTINPVSFATPNYTASSVTLGASMDLTLAYDCPAPTSPTISSVSTVDCSGSVLVNWGLVSGANSYNIYRKYGGGSYGPSPIASVSASTVSYTDSAIFSGSNYIYAVSAVADCGSEGSKSTDSSVVAPTIAASITGSPASVTTSDGHTAVFTVIANNATAYQWQINRGSGFTNAIEGTDGVGSSTSIFTNVAATTNMNGFKYRCVVSGSCTPSTVTSSAATLFVATYFKSLASGTYNVNTTWQISTNGNTGWTAAPAGVFPGIADQVEIQNTHTVALGNATQNAGNLTIDGTGVLVFGSGTGSGLARTLNISGNFTNNGAIQISAKSIVHSLNFTGNAIWVGSGDVSTTIGSTAAGIAITNNSGMILDVSGLTTPIKLPNSGAVVSTFTVNGILNSGGQTISGNGANNVFTLASGATLISSNANGINNGASGTLNFTSAPVLSSGANYIFNGTSAQITIGLPATVNSLTIANGVGVTLSSAVNSALLQLNSGAILNLGTGLTSTAGYLLFGGSQQAAGSWGNSASAASHIDNARFAISSGIVNVSYFLTVNQTAVTDASCNGGSFSVAASGGSGAYQYSTNGTAFQSSGTFLGLAASTYAVTAIDAVGVTATTAITINQLPTFTAGSPTYYRTGGQSYKVPIASILGLATGDGAGSASLVSVDYTTAGFKSLLTNGTYVFVGTNTLVDSFSYMIANDNGCLSSGTVTLALATDVVGQVSASIDTSSSNPTISYAGIPGYSYSVQRTPSMANPIVWTTIWTTNAPSGGLFAFTDPNPTHPTAFYRLAYNAPSTGTLSSAKYPGQNFNLTGFTIQLPINGSGVENTGVGDAYGTLNDLTPVVYTNSSNPDYCNGNITNYFYTGIDGAMTFWAPDTGSTTPGSTHPRSELYSQTYFHTAGTHSLNVQCKVLQVTASGKVTIGQIKCFGSGISPNTEALMVIYDNGSIYGRFNTNYDTGTSTAQGYNYYYPATVNIGDPITYQIIESNNMVSLTVNGVTHTDTLAPTWTGFGANLYFKTGSYSQNNVGDTNSSTLGSRVAIYTILAQP